MEVSIIIGVYNAETRIEASLYSILNQTFQDFEIIVCNDCSTDNTYSLLLQIQKKYPNKIVVLNNEKNISLAGALNRCLSVAKGKYIARIDDDDIALPNRLAIQHKFMQEHPDIDCVGSSIYLNNNNGKIRKISKTPSLSTLVKGQYAFYHPTIMIKKDVMYNLKGYSTDLKCLRCEDLDLWYRFFLDGYTGYNISNPLLIYHESANDFKKRTLSKAINIFKLRNFYLRKTGYSNFYSFIYIKSLLLALLPPKLAYFIKSKFA